MLVDSTSDFFFMLLQLRCPPGLHLLKCSITKLMKHLFQTIIIITVISICDLHSQEIIFPGLRGDSLTTELKKYYTPKTILSYDQARNKLYTEIFLQNDSLECFYSGYKIPVPSGTNILSWTAKYGIQTEHLFPRSFGSASMPALGDLHHLVPARSPINTLRRNAPFVDIPDEQTKYWIHKDKVITTIPGKEISLYSESKSNAFEPIEFRKGDIARSLFYFYTFYRSEVDKKSKTFFTSMLPDLCRWHRSDRVDYTEINRSLAIARIQSTVNPFIFDPSLAERCYCASYPDKPASNYKVNIYPNPSKGLFYIDIPNYKGPVIMKISDGSGRLIETHHFMYTALMSWRLSGGIFIFEILIPKNPIIKQTIVAK